jgi:hypothetical protein
MGCCTSFGEVAIGQVSLVHIPSAGLVFLGLESPTSGVGTPAIVFGDASIAGDHIVYMDSPHQVDIQAASADAIQVHNASSGVRAGNVTLIW